MFEGFISFEKSTNTTSLSTSHLMLKSHRNSLMTPHQRDLCIKTPHGHNDTTCDVFSNFHFMLTSNKNLSGLTMISWSIVKLCEIWAKKYFHLKSKALSNNSAKMKLPLTYIMIPKTEFSDLSKDSESTSVPTGC